MDSLDLLKSLTTGVNNKAKASSNFDEDVVYKVNTSLRRNKKPKQEVVNEDIKKDELNIESNDIVETYISETYEIIEENYDMVEEIVEEISFDMDDSFNNKVEVVVDSKADELQINTIDDDIELDCDNKDIQAVEDKDGHKLEELTVKESEKPKDLKGQTVKSKIDRGGNPFKRGPRKKKNQVIEEANKEYITKEEVNNTIENSDIELLVNEQPIVEEPIVEELIIEDSVKDNENIIEDKIGIVDAVIDEGVLEVLLNQAFNEEEIEKFDSIEEEVESDEEDEVVLEENVEVVSNIMGDIEDISIVDGLLPEDDNTSEDDTTIEEVSIIENIVFEDEVVFDEPKSVKKQVNQAKAEKKHEENIVFGEDVDFSFDTKDEVENETIEEVNEEEDKFKNCKYYGGMSVEEFLRQNPNYREAFYVEHFYNKDMLNKLLDSGVILFKKGLYRL